MRTGTIVRILMLLTLSLALASFLGGCSGSSNDNDAGYDAGKDGDGGGGDQNPGLTICDIQNANSPKHPATKTTVTINGVIVTTPMYMVATASTVPDGFWVQDPAGCGADGAKWSGTFVYAKTLTVTVNPGDKVDIAGVYDVSYGLNEIVATTVTTTGTGTIPAPVVVTPTQVKTGGPDAAAYQNVLVEADNVTMANPKVLGTDGQAHGDWSVKATGGNDELIISYKFKTAAAPYGYVYTSRANNSFAKIIGVLDYSYNENRVNPRLCGDLMKNATDSICPTCAGTPPTVTISQIQNPTQILESCAVNVQNVIATTRGFYSKSSGRSFMFVEDPAGGEWSGIYVTGRGLDFSSIKRGDKLTISGTVSSYYWRNELDASALPTDSGAGTLPTPAVVTPSDIATNGPRADNYVGVLVEVQNVQVTDKVFPGTDGADHGEFEIAAQSDLTKKLVVGNTFIYTYSCRPITTDGGSTPCATDERHVGDNFTSITGVMDYNNDNNKLEPRDDADLVK